MSNKATAKINLSGPSPGDDVKPARDRSSHPLDSWLKNELESLYEDMESKPLPTSLAELAAELEAKLQSARSKK